ncbi:alanyl-tRNA synthetase [Streptomyces virginiae]|uniref:Alanine--tRNA ligase n=1 Tax=Streptomyces virginiae TaxID=1961 RepID=A0A0L8N2J1_STRVG|nr:alanine--tRNA ligase [Streptomyces virginiae]KOG56912.1 alanyl-tRNA synthetase [Streptomyces virginiae]
MQSAEIHRRWLNFFKQRGHVVAPSASLIADDPTLLLVNAGMVPYKTYFLGESTPNSPRITSIQKCVRTLDIEEVGKTTRHGSFFQMCGNFSFGDYFKEGAIKYAWELLTTSVADGGFGLDSKKLWITVHESDDEAERIWREVIGFPSERIQRLGSDNFWSMGVPGPCGPCTEINYDRGDAYGIEGGPAVNSERYLEIWSVVFMQYERGFGGSKGEFDIIGDLPRRNIDTGLGLERIASILQGVDNIFEIDTSRPILEKAAQVAGCAYGDSEKSDISLRVATDHFRTATMLIGDGIIPANEGRGYVLRRILRRAVRNMRLLGATSPTAERLTNASIDAMADQYPYLMADRGRIVAIAVQEESAFLRTLRAGTNLLDAEVENARRAGKRKLSAESAFRLHDTCGFPIDLTLEMAEEQGLRVDEIGFRRLMQEQRDRAKADALVKKDGNAGAVAYRELAGKASPTFFVGYTQSECESKVVGLLVDGSAAPVASEGDNVEFILDRTPFYAEGGGQLADRGRIRLDSGALVEVRDVQKPLPGLIVHSGQVLVGEVTHGSSVYAAVDLERRRAISRAHSATHLTHQALRDALGPTAAQAGSENAPGRFRFDFSSPNAVTTSTLIDVEQKLNEVLAGEHDVRAETMTIEEARKAGAIAMFGESYGSHVRVVSIGDFSKELCAGTHVGNTAQLGLIKLLGESSIGSGVRRLEALVGIDAYRYFAREHLIVSQVSEVMRTRPEGLADRISIVLNRLRDAEKEIERFRVQEFLNIAADLEGAAEKIGGFSFIGASISEAVTLNDLRSIVLDVRKRMRLRPSVIALFSVVEDRAIFVISVSDHTHRCNLKSGDLAQTAAGVLGGGGGGNGEIAQGSGTQIDAIDSAIKAIRAQVERVSLDRLDR